MNLKQLLAPKDEKMQTQTDNRRISSRIRPRIPIGSKPDVKQIRGRRASKNVPTPFQSPGADILNFKFRNIIVGEGLNERESLFDSKDIDKEYSVKYLYDSAKNYCRLLDKEFTFKPSGDAFKDILDIYYDFHHLLPDGQGLNIDFQTGGNYFYFIVYGSCNFPDEFVFLPIKAVDKMNSELAGVFKHFVKFFSTSQSIDFAQDHYDMSYVLDCWFPDIIDNESEHDEDEVKMAKEYIAGHVSKKMIEFNKQKVLDADEILNECNTLLSKSSGTDQELLQIIINGIPLLQEDRLGNYGYDTGDDSLFNDGYRDDMSSVDFGRTLAIIWDDEDSAGQMFMEVLNSSIGGYGCQDPSQIVLLKPNTKKCLEVSDYPLRFREWFIELIIKLARYE